MDNYISKLKWAWRAQFLSQAPKILRKCTTFKDVQMMFLWVLDISIGFRFWNFCWSCHIQFLSHPCPSQKELPKISWVSKNWDRSTEYEGVINEFNLGKKFVCQLLDKMYSLGYDFVVSSDLSHQKDVVSQGWLENWIWQLQQKFPNLKPVEISKSPRNIICTSLKVVHFHKILGAWVKNWARRANFSFEI